jgi:hypothetical protein
LFYPEQSGGLLNLAKEIKNKNIKDKKRAWRKN